MLNSQGIVQASFLIIIYVNRFVYVDIMLYICIVFNFLKKNIKLFMKEISSLREPIDGWAVIGCCVRYFVPFLVLVKKGDTYLELTLNPCYLHVRDEDGKSRSSYDCVRVREVGVDALSIYDTSSSCVSDDAFWGIHRFIQEYGSLDQYIGGHYTFFDGIREKVS